MHSVPPAHAQPREPQLIEAVIFDMDGLLFDTERLAIRSWADAARDSGYDIPMEVLLKTIGRDKEAGRRMLMEECGEAFPYGIIREKRLRHFADHIEAHGVPVKEGLRGLLRTLRERGIPLAVATSTDRARALWLLERGGIAPHFDAIICGDEVANCKPDPEIYLKAAQALGRAPENCLVLEDSPIGIRAAHAAGMRAIMVPDLIEPDEAVLSKVWNVCRNLAEVERLISAVDMA